MVVYFLGSGPVASLVCCFSGETQIWLGDLRLVVVVDAKGGLTICEICPISSSTFEIGQRIFVSEQGQRFHLTRFCRTFKSLPVTEYTRCGTCCSIDHSAQVLLGNSIPRRRRTTSSTSSIAGISGD